MPWHTLVSHSDVEENDEEYRREARDPRQRNESHKRVATRNGTRGHEVTGSAIRAAWETDVPSDVFRGRER